MKAAISTETKTKASRHQPTITMGAKAACAALLLALAYRTRAAPQAEAECSAWKPTDAGGRGFKTGSGCCAKSTGELLLPAAAYRTAFPTTFSTQQQLQQAGTAKNIECRALCQADMFCAAAWLDTQIIDTSTTKTTTKCYLFSFAHIKKYEAKTHGNCDDTFDRCMMKDGGCKALPTKGKPACSRLHRCTREAPGGHGSGCQVPTWLSTGRCAGDCTGWEYDAVTQKYSCDTLDCPLDKKKAPLAVCDIRADCTGWIKQGGWKPAATG